MKIVDQNGFNEALNNKYVLVDFYADWCGPCKMVGPVLEELDAENDQLTIVKVNVDNELDLASKYGVQSIPNMIFFKKVRLLHRSLVSQIRMQSLIKSTHLWTKRHLIGAFFICVIFLFVIIN